MMNQYNTNIAEKIIDLRKLRGLTQEQLAEQLGVTFQAVSKWENGLSCPDIALLPLIAQVFEVSIDELFGKIRSEKEDVNENKELPWEDDDQLRIVVYRGHDLVKQGDAEIEKLVFKYRGQALNVASQISISCEHIEGNASAGGGVNCGDIGGDVSAGGAVNCGDIGGDVSAGSRVNCGDIGGDVSAGDAVNCGDIGGSVSTGGTISCGDIEGDVNTGSDVSARNIQGNVTAQKVKCEEIEGNVYYKDNLSI